VGKVVVDEVADHLHDFDEEERRGRWLGGRLQEPARETKKEQDMN
jgi:hypothetical protein